MLPWPRELAFGCREELGLEEVELGQDDDRGRKLGVWAGLFSSLVSKSIFQMYIISRPGV